METSKKILLALLIPTYLLIGLTIVAMFMGYDAGYLVTLTECLIGCVTIGVSFYYWKAKAENIVKISKTIPSSLKDKIDVNNMMNM